MPGATLTDSDSQAEEPAGLFSGKVPINVALNELRLRLLEMSGRNRLINFRHSPGKSLQFVHSTIDGVFKRLTEQNNRASITPLPDPPQDAWVTRNGRLSRPEPKEWADHLGISTDYGLAPKKPAARGSAHPVTGADLRALHYPEDLGRHCRKLEREAKLALEETGANMLYLVAGFLEFPEAPDSDRLYQAPLLCIPVTMSRVDEARYSSFFLSHTGEDLSDNLSLREKLKRDFAFNLPEFDPEGDESAEAYLTRVGEAVERLPNWRVKPMLTLALLSFTNMLLVRDLEPDAWQKDGETNALTEHPLVRQVFEGSPHAGGIQYAQEYAVDDHPMADLPIIYDADSSQHSALIDVIEGNSRVIEGPPGTGKSQTITNLIAAGLQAGKTILFASEKLAALEVVKSRLNQAGLSPFVLELHSNKTSKKAVLDDIAARMALRIPDVHDLPDLIASREAKRKELKAYADLMNTKAGNALDLTLHQVMWRAERHRLQAGPSAEAVQALEFFTAPRTSAVQLEEMGAELRRLATQLGLIGAYGSTHPLWGFFPQELSPEQDVAVQQVLRDFAARFGSFAKATHQAATFLGNSELDMSAQGARRVLAALDSIAPAGAPGVDFASLPRLFPTHDPDGSRSLVLLQDVQRRLDHIAALNGQLEQALLSSVPARHDEIDTARRLVDDARSLGLEQVPWPSLAKASTDLDHGARRASAALEQLRQYAAAAGLEVSDQVTEIASLKAVIAVALDAPLTALSHRHAGLALPIAPDKLKDGLVKREKLEETRARAEASMYLDAIPSTTQLDEAVQTFREGDAWYRIFQSRWRAARQLHRRLSRDKSARSAAQCLQDLELLMQMQTLRRDLEEDPALREVSGAWYAAERTPFAELFQAADWLARARMTLEGAGVRTSVFDPLTATRAVMDALKASSSQVDQRLGVLAETNTSALGILGNAMPRILKSANSPAWSLRIETWLHAAKVAQEAHEFARPILRPTASLAQGLAALQAHQEVPKLEAELQGDTVIKAMVGDRFRGARTDLSALFAAHRYGSLIRNAALPKVFENLLISERSEANHAVLMACADAVSQGWQDTVAFGEAMSGFGRFEPTLWADPGGKSTSGYAAELTEKTATAAASLSRLLPWVQYIAARERALALGLQGFVEKLECGHVAPDKLEHAFIHRFYVAIAKAAFDATPELKRFSGARHSAVRNEYAELDRQIIELRGLQVARACLQQSKPPAGHHGLRVGDKTEMQLLQHLVTQQRPRVPVRQILRRAGRAIQELKPCFMMGPQSVAQFLEPGRFAFDIVIMDEASQLRPEQAIGAVARGAQLVVVGDPKQLPPTSFFSRAAAVDDDADGVGQLATSDAESILDVCMAHFRPVRTLRWHYRSRHESLIAFSNQHFYRGNLVVFPSPHAKGKSLGLSYHHVNDGVYENQMNPIEARRVVDAAVEHILLRPDDSLGIVTLNIKQRDLVAELLDERLRSLPQAGDFKEKWETEGLGLFVKNLENVQGDERDAILISTTFGKAKGTSVVRQNFGPISRTGGWRRLNVLFTRARKSVAVYSSMRPEDIVSDGRTPEGTRTLRNYLEFARDGVLPMTTETGRPPDSDFEIAVMEVLRAKGYEVTPQLGVAGFRIDIAVKHPRHLSGYLAAIECDGAAYHSGVSVRDRDRIRQEILENLGWRGRIWRIWSTDWFRNPLAETERLLQFLMQLQEQAVVDQPPVGSETKSSAQGSSAETTGDAASKGEESAKEPSASKYGKEMLQGQIDFEDTRPEVLVFDSADDLAIEIGDLVTYAREDAPNEAWRILLTARQTDSAAGLVAHNTPLGEALMGATVGETVVLRIPGKPAQVFVIKAIRRS